MTNRGQVGGWAWVRRRIMRPRREALAIWLALLGGMLCVAAVGNVVLNAIRWRVQMDAAIRVIHSPDASEESVRAAIVIIQRNGMLAVDALRRRADDAADPNSQHARNALESVANACR